MRSRDCLPLPLSLDCYRVLALLWVRTGAPRRHAVGAARPPPPASARILHGVRPARGVQHVFAHPSKEGGVGEVSGSAVRDVVGRAPINLVGEGRRHVNYSSSEYHTCFFKAGARLVVPALVVPPAGGVSVEWGVV